jgi:hypothetical protein
MLLMTFQIFTLVPMTIRSFLVESVRLSCNLFFLVDARYLDIRARLMTQHLRRVVQSNIITLFVIA